MTKVAALLGAVLATLQTAAAQQGPASTYFPAQVCRPQNYVWQSGVQIDLDFYKKWVDVDGVPVLSSGKVPDEALAEAANWIRLMTANLPSETRGKLREFRVRETVMAITEKTLDVPEHNWLDPSYNTRTRGLGATDDVPVTTSAEENVLQYGPGRDVYAGECILLHELGHTIFDMAVAKTRPDLLEKLKNAYDDAHAKGLYKGFYADTNYQEYWAEGTQAWFDCTAQHPTKSREALRTFDPSLAAITEEVYGANSPRYRKPDMAQLRASLKPCTLTGGGPDSSIAPVPAYKPGASFPPDVPDRPRANGTDSGSGSNSMHATETLIVLGAAAGFALLL
jgi:hypothetical protein